LRVPTNQIGDIGVGTCHATKDAPASLGGLDVANVNVQMPFTIFAAAIEGRVSGEGDALRRGGQLVCQSRAKRLADPNRQSLTW